MFKFLLNCFCIGVGLPEIQIFNSVSRSRCPAVSTLKWVMLL